MTMVAERVAASVAAFVVAFDLALVLAFVPGIERGARTSEPRKRLLRERGPVHKIVG